MSLRPPLRLATVDAQVGSVVRDWARRSLGPREACAPALAEGTLLLRTGGEWDCVVAVSERVRGELRPVVVFKYPVALWQCSRDRLQDGDLVPEQWAWLRRQVLIHNPGLGGLLELLDATVVAQPPR